MQGTKSNCSPQFWMKNRNIMSLCLSKKKQSNSPFWGECLLHLLHLQDFQVSATITEIAESIILVLGNTSCTAAHWMWIIFHGVMHYYAGFNYRIIDWSFPQNTDLIYFDSKYLQNWLWHNHGISVVLWSVWPEEGLAWLKTFTISGCCIWANALLYFFLQTCSCLYP